MDFEVARMPSSSVYKLLVGLVAPRPIALVTSMDAEGGLNAAPFSAYNYLSIDPPIIGIGIAPRPEGHKDTLRNIRTTGEFVVNVVTEDIGEKMNLCAIDFPAGVNELEVAGFTTTASKTVKVPRIGEAHAALECREFTTLNVGRSAIVLGRVVGLHIEDRFVDPEGPYVKAEELHSIGRMNGLGNYVHTRDAFFAIPRIPLAEWNAREEARNGGPTG